MAYRKRDPKDRGIYPHGKDPISKKDRWAIRWRERGKLQHELVTGTRAEARDLRNAKIADAKRGRAAPIPGRTTFEDLVELLKASYAKKQNRTKPPLKHLTEAFAGTLAADITTERVERYEAERRAAGDSRGTINLSLAALRRALRLAHKFGRLATVPAIETPDPGNARQVVITPEELTAILDALPPWAAAVVRFLSLTGWRVGEALRLTWRHIDQKKKVVRLETTETKGKDARTFPFDQLPALEQLLARQRALPVASAFVFSKAGGPVPYKALRKAWKAACRKAKCGGKRMHDLRRMVATAFVDAGVDEHTIMKLCGWKTPATFRRYHIVNEDAKSAAVAKLAAALSG